jgi:hypothetical protein
MPYWAYELAGCSTSTRSVLSIGVQFWALVEYERGAGERDGAESGSSDAGDSGSDALGVD